MTDPEKARDLLKRIAARDDQALETLYCEYSKPLFGVIYSIVKTKEDAEETLLDVFHQVWEHASSFDSAKGTVWGWLLAMARNRAIDITRSKRYKSRERENGSEEEFENAPQDGDPMEGMERARRMERIRKAMESISPDQRRVLEEAYFEGRSQSEVAEKLRLPLGTVKTRMRDGMRNLQNMLRGYL